MPHTLVPSDRVEHANVYGQDGAKLGTIERLMLDKVTGTVAYAVIKTGGMLASHHHYPVRWNALRFDPARQAFMVELTLEDLLPSADAGPEAAYARSVLLEEIEAALDELPEEQRYVFVAHELEGRSFKELTAETGLGLNTLLSRKHYAVLHLRERLQAIYDEFMKTGGRER